MAGNVTTIVCRSLACGTPKCLGVAGNVTTKCQGMAWLAMLQLLFVGP